MVILVRLGVPVCFCGVACCPAVAIVLCFWVFFSWLDDVFVADGEFYFSCSVGFLSCSDLGGPFLLGVEALL